MIIILLLSPVAGITIATKLASDDMTVQEQLAHIYNEMGAAYMKNVINDEQSRKAEEMFIKALKLYNGMRMYTEVDMALANINILKNRSYLLSNLFCFMCCPLLFTCGCMGPITAKKEDYL